MRIQSFDAILSYDLRSAADLLLASITLKNELKYKRYDALVQEYMEKIGNFEQQVIYSDLEVQMKKRTEQMIISARNRREYPDIEKITETVQAEFQQKLDKLSSPPSKHSVPELTDEQKATMSAHYQELVRVLHPELNPDEAESEKELYLKVVECYRNDDYQAIEIAYSTIFPANDHVKYAEPSPDQEEVEARKQIEEYKRYSASDYTLARKIFPCFRADSSQLAMIEKCKEYMRMTSREDEEIEKIKNSFPFTAEKMLGDRSQTEEYLEKLRKRLEKNRYEISETEKRISALLE